MQTQDITVKSILNPTGGFLGGGFTHTINVYRGCPLGNSLCGLYCYAQWNPYHTQGRHWGDFLDIKKEVVELYQRDYDRVKRPVRGEPKPLRVYMSSVTEPYPPQERMARRTRLLLEAMLARPPDTLVIQSHTPLMLDDLALLQALRTRCRLQLNITVETDLEVLPAAFPRHAYSPASRIDALAQLRAAGLPTVATVSPLLPLADVRSFAEALERAADRVILDHYLLGDGSPGGLRTKRTPLPMLLSSSGWETWTTLDRFHEIVATFRARFGPERVGVSQEGFNSLAADIRREAVGSTAEAAPGGGRLP